MNRLTEATKYAWVFVGKPYVWAGDDPIAGFDCSGLVVEILKSVGLVGRNEDYTAAGLFEKFKADSEDYPSEGALVFWETNGKITHVEYCINSFQTIGASGGGSKTKTKTDAIQQNAYVKVRPIIGGRPRYKYIVNPFH